MEVRDFVPSHNHGQPVSISLHQTVVLLKKGTDTCQKILYHGEWLKTVNVNDVIHFVHVYIIPEHRHCYNYIFPVSASILWLLVWASVCYSTWNPRVIQAEEKAWVWVSSSDDRTELGFCWILYMKASGVVDYVRRIMYVLCLGLEGLWASKEQWWEE